MGKRVYEMSKQNDVQSTPSEQAKKKAQAAKEYIENMYRLQQQSIQERMERCVLAINSQSLECMGKQLGSGYV